MDIFKPDFDFIKDKTKISPLANELYIKALAYADETLEIELPAKPLEHYVKPCMEDGKFTEEFLVHCQLYDDTSWLFEKAFTALAFAYRMTGGKPYLDKWLACLDACLMNEPWGPGAVKYDHCSSRLCRALSVSASWVMDELSSGTVKRIDARLAREVDGFIETYARSGDMYPLGPNDHQSKAIAGAGVAALFLLPRLPEREPALERLTELFIKLLPETVTPGGGWIDGYDFYFYAMMDCVFFLDALENSRSRNLIFHPGMKEAAENALYALGAHEGFSLSAPYGLFWIADRYGLPPALETAQRIMQDGAFPAECAAYALLFYNTGQKAAPLPERVHINRDFGLGRLGEGYSHENAYLWMRSGPAEAFCRNNQNGILLTAFGKQLLANTVTGSIGYVKLWEIVYKYGLWETGNATAIMINGNNQMKNRYGEDWEPIKPFHRPGRPKWGDDTMWWFDYEEPKEQYGRFIGGEDCGRVLLMSASADGVFGKQASAYTRHCAMIDGRLVVIIDCIKAGGEASTIQFRGNSPQKISVRDGNVCITAENGVSARGAFTGTRAVSLSTGVWPFQPDKGGYFTAEMAAKPGANLLVSVFMLDRVPHDEAMAVALEKNDSGYIAEISGAGEVYKLYADADGSGLRF